MADNITLNSGSGGQTAWTDEVTGSKHAQYVKLADGTADSTTVIAGGGGVEAGALRVTVASDSTGVLSVDDNGGSLTVDVGTSLPAGTNAIGKLAANSGVDIGDVDVTSIIPGTGAINLGKAIDSASGATDTGVGILTIRDDVLTDLTPAEGDWVPLRTNSVGALWVSHDGPIVISDGGGSVTVDNGGTFAVQVSSAIPAGTNNIGDVDVLTVPADPFGANADAASATGSISAKLRFIAATGIPITGSVVVTNAGTFAVQAAQSGTWNVTNISGTVSLPTGASTLAEQQSQTTHLATIAGDTTAIETAVQIMDDWDNAASDGCSVSGDVAHDAADAGEPVKMGARATASVLGGTPVAAADRVNLAAGTDGVLIVRQGTSLEDIISEQKTNTDGASTAMTGAFAATASQRIYLTDIIIANSSTTNITVDIRDGSAGSVLATFPVPANGGVVHRFGTPLRFTANTAAAFDGSAAVTTLSVSMVGFKSKA